MRSLFSEAIIDLELILKEVESKKRKCYGFHLFLSYYFQHNNIKTEKQAEVSGLKVACGR